MKKLILSFILSLCLINNGYCVDNWDATDPAGTENAADLDALIIANNNALDRFLAYGVHGCKLSYASASTLTVGIGSVVCSNSAGTVRKLRTNTTATTVSWSNIDTGSEAVSTTYSVYAIGDADASTFTVVVSTNSALPSGTSHDYFCKLGSFYNNAAGDITAITNITGDSLRSYDSGWFAVGLATTYTKTHSLGTTKVLCTLWYSASSDGSSAIRIDQDGGSAGDGYTAVIDSLSSTSVSVKTGSSQVCVYYSAGVRAYYASGYYKLILLALD